MPFTSASVSSGATVAPTGGSALAFTGQGIRNNAHTAVAMADTSLLLRRSITASVKEPKVSVGAPNGYTQARATIVFKSPLALDNGNHTVNTVRIELAYDEETTSAEIEELRIIAAQLLADSDFDNLWKGLSLA